ncbi:MAG: hypothetical protein ACPGVS_07275, partial [Primorskyibacter sp.]
KAASKTASSDSSAAAQGKAASSEQPPVPQASASQNRSKGGADVAPQSKAAKTGVTASAPPSRYGEGTIWGLCLAMAIVAVYLAAPWITNQIPGSAVWIAPFAEGIDAARLWMSEIVEAGGADGV